MLYSTVFVNQVLSIYLDFFWGIICLIWNFTGLLFINSKEKIFKQKLFKLFWYFNFITVPIIKNTVNLLYLNQHLTSEQTNIIEHLILSFGIFVLLTPLISLLVKENKTKLFIKNIITLSFVTLVGVLNELADFAIIILENSPIYYYHYTDTIRDISINLLGCLLGILVITILDKLNFVVLN